MVTKKMRKYRKELEETRCWRSEYKKLSESELKEKANIATLFSYMRCEFQDPDPSDEHYQGEFCWHEIFYFYGRICRIFRNDSKQIKFLSTNPFGTIWKVPDDDWGLLGVEYSYREIIAEITKNILEVVYKGEDKTDIGDYLFSSDKITIVQCMDFESFNIPKKERMKAHTERLKHWELARYTEANRHLIPELNYKGIT